MTDSRNKLVRQLHGVYHGNMSDGAQNEYNKNPRGPEDISTTLHSISPSTDSKNLDQLTQDDLLRTSKMTNKIFNDPIHGHIEMNSACMAIIDTPEFQRLRFVKQLGLVYFVFPGASHNRFEHSLGTSHLSGLFARTLRENQPQLGITDKDILCVQLAGLCHDLGHGPLSHLFDQQFIPNSLKSWKHEDASVAMFTHIIQKYQLMEPCGILRRDYGLDERDITFIKEMIIGLNFSTPEECSCQGRGKHKSYLYEIVSNKRNNIDVDKFDYFARDCHQLGINNSFDYTRFMKFARVTEVQGVMQICIREKEISCLYNMFFTRYNLHRRAYQHRVKSIIEKISWLRLSECIHDMEAYAQLTDDVISMILRSTSQEPEMIEARAILSRIQHRDLYRCIYETKPIIPTCDKINESEIKSKILELVSNETIVDETAVLVSITYLDFGMKNMNPVERINVYSKWSPNKARQLNKEEASRILGPDIFSEIIVRIMYSDNVKNKSDEEIIHRSLQTAAKQWEKSLTEVDEMKMDM
ncbi:SAM domain and HD [Bulinus truncatus]|nr:SAM domain and HD [Bulinus truncatus]